MRYIIIVIIGLCVGGIGAWYYVGSQSTDYKAPEVITNIVTEEVEVDALNQMIADAINASSTSIQEAAQEAFNATVLRLEKQIELDVRRGQQEVGELKIEELEKEVGEY